jgi:hypothetical protein
VLAGEVARQVRGGQDDLLVVEAVHGVGSLLTAGN